LCRQSAQELSKIKEQLDKASVGFVAIGSGTPLMAKSFQSDYGFTGKLYCDQSRKIYDELGCQRGLKYVFNGQALSALKKAVKEGYSQGKTQGDNLQLGGVFLISKSRGMLWQHLETFAGDHASNEEIMKAVQEATNNSMIA